MASRCHFQPHQLWLSMSDCGLSHATTYTAPDTTTTKPPIQIKAIPHLRYRWQIGTSSSRPQLRPPATVLAPCAAPPRNRRFRRNYPVRRWGACKKSLCFPSLRDSRATRISCAKGDGLPRGLAGRPSTQLYAGGTCGQIGRCFQHDQRTAQQCFPRLRPAHRLQSVAGASVGAPAQRKLQNAAEGTNQ
jgi:hypothetical protein